jgi:hypothetical protein
MTWTLVVVEGFADRAFLQGLFEQRAGAKRYPVGAPAPWGNDGKGGWYSFWMHERPVLVVPPRNNDGGLKHLESAWAVVASKPSRVVVVVDSDQSNDESPIHGRRRVATVIRRVGGSLDEHSGTGQIGDAVVEAVVWRGGPGEPRPGVPAKHTLERLIAESFADVWPDRASDVGRWLATAPTPDDVTHKHVASAILAKWFAEDGPSDAFYRKVWFEPALAGRLEARLREQGEWDRFTRLGGAPGDRSLSA